MASSSFLPPDLLDTVNQAKSAGMSDEDIVGSLSKHPVYGSRVQGILSQGASPSDVVGAIMGAPKQSGSTGWRYTDPHSVSSPMYSNATGTKQAVTQNDVPLSGTEQAAMAPLGLFSGGATQFGKGASEAKHAKTGDELAHGLSDVARGAGTLMLPIAAPALMTVPGLVGATTGAAAGYGAEQGLKAAGVPSGYAELAGDVAGAGAGTGSAMGTQAAFRINPQVAAERAWRPTPADSQFPQVTTTAGSDVKTYGNPGVRTNADTIPSANNAIKVFQQGLESYLNRAEQAGVQIPGDILVQATQRAIPDLMWVQDPASAQALVNDAQRDFGGKYFDVARWRNWLKTENASLSQFYNQAGAKQAAGLAAGRPQGIESAQTAAMRDALYQYLSPEDNGAGPREIQDRTGNIINLRNNAERASNRVTGEHALSPAEGFGKVATGAARLVGAPFQHGDVPGAMRQIMNPMQGPTDALIGQFYDVVPHAQPIPQPASPQHPWGAGMAQRALPAPINLPAQEDTSYVRSVPAMPQPPNPARALPAASTFMMPPSEASGQFPHTSSSPLVSPSGPSYGVTPNSLATQMGKSIRQFLGDPTVK